MKSFSEMDYVEKICMVCMIIGLAICFKSCMDDTQEAIVEDVQEVIVPTESTEPELEITTIHWINENLNPETEKIKNTTVIVDFTTPRDLTVWLQEGVLRIDTHRVLISKDPVEIYQRSFRLADGRTRLIIETLLPGFGE